MVYQETRKIQDARKAYLTAIASPKSNQFANAKKEAEEVTKIMSEKYDINDDYAKDAPQTAVEIMQVPGETRERLAAPVWCSISPPADPLPSLRSLSERLKSFWLRC